MRIISSLFYCIGQGIKSTFKNKWFTLASIATIGACLFLFGICVALVLNVQNMVKTAEQGVVVTVFFDDGLPDERVQEIGNMILAHTAVDHTVFVSADEAWDSFKTEYLGEYADGFTENPLADSENYQIYMNDVSRQAELVAYLESIDGVRRVNKSELTADFFSGANSLITYVSMGIIGILLAVSVFLISNTVMIGITVRGEEISIMKYIGATDFFVRSPFVIEGMIIGAVGALIPLAIIYVLYNKAIDYVMRWYSGFSSVVTFLPVNAVFYYLIPVSVGLGIGIGFLGSFLTVRKHLHV
ncbi:MAG: permease-like cell division protein FtsX [Lachnospiraceae bacterium]|nr:permease-like cell division protein FtsX [Lachnospiraceae bacterium]